MHAENTDLYRSWELFWYGKMSSQGESSGNLWAPITTCTALCRSVRGIDSECTMIWSRSLGREDMGSIWGWRRLMCVMILYKVDSYQYYFLNFKESNASSKRFFWRWTWGNVRQIWPQGSNISDALRPDRSPESHIAGVWRNWLGGNYSISVNSLMPANFLDWLCAQCVLCAHAEPEHPWRVVCVWAHNVVFSQCIWHSNKVSCPLWSQRSAGVKTDP
jgi:hypothetical protein